MCVQITPSQLRNLPLEWFEQKESYFTKLAATERKYGAIGLARKNEDAADGFRLAIKAKRKLLAAV